jgi:hypothetical protein
MASDRHLLATSCSSIYRQFCRIPASPCLRRTSIDRDIHTREETNKLCAYPNCLYYAAPRFLPHEYRYQRSSKHLPSWCEVVHRRHLDSCILPKTRLRDDEVRQSIKHDSFSISYGASRAGRRKSSASLRGWSLSCAEATHILNAALSPHPFWTRSTLLVAQAQGSG